MSVKSISIPDEKILKHLNMKDNASKYICNLIIRDIESKDDKLEGLLEDKIRKIVNELRWKYII